MQGIKVINIEKGGEDYTNNVFDLIVMFDNPIDEKKLPRLKEIIQRHINRPIGNMDECTVEIETKNGTVIFSKEEIIGIAKNMGLIQSIR